MEEMDTDVVVIGSGPSGQRAAIQAAKLGASVVIVEKDAEPGGACLHSGTIPSKSLREAILNLTDFYSKSFYGGNGPDRRDISISDLNFCLSRVLVRQTEMLKEQFARNGVGLIRGTARFENHRRVAVQTDEEDEWRLINGKKMIIATGSKPRRPVSIPFDDEAILDSTRLLSIDRIPKDMIVLGGGIIGAEYASFFAALGTQVTVIDKGERLLRWLDEEIGTEFQGALGRIGLRFIGCQEIDSVTRAEKRTKVSLKGGVHKESDVVFCALGRVADVERLHIENAGVSLDEKGYIPVNALFQTRIPNIYAVGDVIGGPSLASTGFEQGRLAARHALGVETHHFPSLYPVGIYTIPEISSCGYTEVGLKTLGFSYEVGRAYYRDIAKNSIAGNDPGMFKILFHADTLEVLGVHIIGRDATELIHIGQVAMTFHAKIDYFIDQVFNYPTYAEGYRIAALNGLNKVRHKR
ncbi:MAG: Si-specific NAD(P)(+) transhydrogenase [Simkaniaceae bacterium]|nr:Si-specific NAD(P)(+) transhydrogenase [Simkaniaceae bacterium]